VGSKAAGPVKQSRPNCSRYSLPPTLLDKPFYFAGESVPLQRHDVRSRLLRQINFLLLDARSVLTDWLSERSRYSWIFDEVLRKEGVPQEFVLFAPVLSALALKAPSKPPVAGWWALDKPCGASDGVEMGEDSWHDDRMDLELSTRCFAARLKGARKELGGIGWLMTAAAYVTSTKTIQDLRQHWNTDQYWDLPLPESAEDLVVRWIALWIINSHRDFYGLKFKDAAPFTFDQVTGLVLSKDLTVAEIAHMVAVPPRQILELNPRIKATMPVLPAKARGKRLSHTIAAPKGKGWVLVDKLKKGGYVAESPKP
jgi:peptidoglycan lytic transglycosylase D